MGDYKDIKEFNVPPLPDAVPGEVEAGKPRGPLQVPSLAPLMEPDSIPPEPTEEEKKPEEKPTEPTAPEKPAPEPAQPPAPIVSLPPEKRERRLYGRIITGLIVTVVILLAVVVFLVVYILNATDETPAAPTQPPAAVETAPVEVPETTSEPAVVAPPTEPPEIEAPPEVDTAAAAALQEEEAKRLAEEALAREAEEQQRQKEQEYTTSLSAFDGMLAAMAGTPEDAPLEKGKYQTIEAFYKNTLSTPDDPFHAQVLQTSGIDTNTAPSETTVSFDALFKVGDSAYLAALAQSDKATDLGEALGSPDAEKIRESKKWLTDWLLNPRGFYCQVRERFWDQAKAEPSPIDEDHRKQFTKVKQQRRKRIVAKGYPKSFMYDRCDREIF